MVNDLLKHKAIPVLLYNILLAFCDTDKKFELQAYLLKMMTITKDNVDIANLSDKKAM